MAEWTLGDARQESLAVVDSVADYAIFLLDRDGRVRTWNKGARLIKLYEPDEIIGSHISRFYPEEDLQGGRPERLLAIAAAEGRVEDEGWRIRKDGTRFWADVVITAIRDPGGAVLGFLKVTRKAVNLFIMEYPELTYGDAFAPHVDLFNHGAYEGVWYGEDYSFSRRWRELGGDIWVLPHLNISHHTTDTKYVGNYHQHLYRQPGGSACSQS